MKSKRGTILDMFLVATIIFAVAVVAVVGLKLWNEVHPVFDEHLNPEAQASLDRIDFFLQGYDYIVILFFFGFFLATLIGAFTLDTHPALFFVSVLFLMVLGVITAQIANMWNILGNTPSLATEVASLPMTTFLLENFPLICIAMGMILIIILYAKTQGSSGGGV